MSTLNAATPSNGATPAREASTPRSPARPSRMAQDNFDSALRRAGERPGSPDDRTSVRDDDDDSAHENLLATAAGIDPPRAAAALPPSAGAVLASDSATAAAQALQGTYPSTWSPLSTNNLAAPPQAWSLQLIDAGLPVQQLNIQRGAAGAHAGLHLSLGTNAANDTRRASLDRLRERLALKGQAPQSLTWHDAPGREQDADDLI